MSSFVESNPLCGFHFNGATTAGVFVMRLREPNLWRSMKFGDILWSLHCLSFSILP